MRQLASHVPSETGGAMFLFSSLLGNAPAQAPAEARGDAPVADALRDASQQTGISFDYLVKTATRESNLDPSAKARNSSATGLFQFLDQTWLQTIKTEGPKLGLQSQADQIVQGSGGQLTVADPQARQKILALRTDPEISAKVAGAFTARNKAVLSDNLGRSPSEGELYIAHFLGVSGATDLIRLASQSPDASAAASFSDAASSNRSIFYDKSGRVRSAAEVYSNLVTGHASDPLPASQAASGAPQAAQADPGLGKDPAGSAYRAKDSAAQPLFGLFRGSDTGPVAKPILNTWGGAGRAIAKPVDGKAVGGQIAALQRSSFFPRDDGSPVATAPAASASPTADSTSAFDPSIPLPPQRPADLTSSTGGRKQTTRQSEVGTPLDLLSFLRQRV